jgi:hypothetical protein
MITEYEFKDLFMNNPNFNTAREILDNIGYSDLTLSPHNITKEIILKVIELHTDKKLEELKQLADLLTMSYNEQVDIAIVIQREKNKLNKKDGLLEFFKAFENPDSPDRLFILVGETGVGKTYVATKRYPKAPVLNCHEGIDAYSLLYTLEPNDKGQLVPVKTPFHLSVINGTESILDEMNLLPHESQMVVQGFTDRKESVVVGSEVVKIGKGFRILATMNPPSETDERRPLGDALLGRAVSYVLELTDDIICQRLKVSKKWLAAIRNLYNHLRASGFVDVRNLDYRDYDKMSRYDFESIIKAKICQGDIANIRNYSTVCNTGEYEKLCIDIREAAKK